MVETSQASEETSHHRLSPLLAPSSVAIYGASTRELAPGNTAVKIASRRADQHGRRIYPINPRYDEIEGLPAYASLDALPEAPDLAIFCVGSERIEQAITEAAARGVKAGVIFASCYLENETTPTLTQRISSICREAGMELCGGNCMGFFNPEDDFNAVAFGRADTIQRGGIALITHSGSQWSSMTQNDTRWRYNLAVSSGQELATSMADYVDYAVDLPSTRVIGLFMKTARKPERFMAALDRARDKGIPVVALKLARTAASAHFAATHSGALAGNYAAYEAIFERYGVMSCTTMNEFAATLLLMSADRRVGDGALAAVLDSGGYRELLADLADDRKVPFANFSDDTMRRLRDRLPSDLEPDNPLDAWSTAAEFEDKFADYFDMVTGDPATAITVGVYDLRNSSPLHQGYTRAMKRVMAKTDKPLAICTNFSAADNKTLAEELADDGIVVFDGTTECLDAVRHALTFRDAQNRRHEDLPALPDEALVRSWADRLISGTGLGEADSLDMLADFGVPAVVNRPADDLAGALAAAREVGFPVALKTAAAGVNHKSDVGGVKLNLADEAAIGTAYQDIADRLGPEVIVSPMAPPGIELSLGMINDPQFGPLVMVGAGGVLVELLKDRCFALAPCSVGEALRMIDRLKMRPMLDGLRGAAPVDVMALAQSVTTFSAMASALKDQVQEIDANPIIVHPGGCIAVDALVVRRPQ